MFKFCAKQYYDTKIQNDLFSKFAKINCSLHLFCLGNVKLQNNVGFKREMARN